MCAPLIQITGKPDNWMSSITQVKCCDKFTVILCWWERGSELGGVASRMSINASLLCARTQKELQRVQQNLLQPREAILSGKKTFFLFTHIFCFHMEIWKLSALMATILVCSVQSLSFTLNRENWISDWGVSILYYSLPNSTYIFPYVRTPQLKKKSIVFLSYYCWDLKSQD